MLLGHAMYYIKPHTFAQAPRLGTWDRGILFLTPCARVEKVICYGLPYICGFKVEAGSPVKELPLISCDLVCGETRECSN